MDSPCFCSKQPSVYTKPTSDTKIKEVWKKYIYTKIKGIPFLFYFFGFFWSGKQISWITCLDFIFFLDFFMRACTIVEKYHYRLPTHPTQNTSGLLYSVMRVLLVTCNFSRRISHKTLRIWNCMKTEVRAQFLYRGFEVCSHNESLKKKLV